MLALQSGEGLRRHSAGWMDLARAWSIRAPLGADTGRICESGSYGDLMAAGGLFTDLVRRQLA